MRCLAALASAALVPFGFWLGGFDFDHRGEGALFCFVMTVYVAVAVGFFPWRNRA